jgi:long-chain acyl-CoA synthetase
MIDVLNESVKQKNFIDYFNRKITFNDFDQYCNNIAYELSCYCDHGDRIAIICENIPQFPIIQYATWKISCTFVPLSPLDSENEIIDKLKFVNARVAIIESDFKEKFNNIISSENLKVFYTDAETFGTLPEDLKTKYKKDIFLEELIIRRNTSNIFKGPAPEDLAMIVFTSGTSGRQKAAEIRHANIYAASYIYKEWFHVNRNDRNLCIAPFFHITGLIFGISLSMVSGSEMVLNYRFDPENALKSIEENKTTITMFVATAYRAMLKSWEGKTDIKNRVKSMRLWSAGGMPMPEKTEIEWKKLTGEWIYMAYGLTESTSPLTLWEYPYKGELKVYKGITSSGKPVYYTKIVSGKGRELIASGPQVVKRYYNNSEDTKKSFSGNRLKTGDIFIMDRDGWIYIIDRKKDIIDVSGYKVVPAELENLIRKVPGVEDVIVVGEKDEYRGETPVAYIKMGNIECDYNKARVEIMDTCKKYLASYKRPSRIVFVESMPVNASGKIKRQDIHSVRVLNK